MFWVFRCLKLVGSGVLGLWYRDLGFWVSLFRCFGVWDLRVSGVWGFGLCFGS